MPYIVYVSFSEFNLAPNKIIPPLEFKKEHIYDFILFLAKAELISSKLKWRKEQPIFYVITSFKVKYCLQHRGNFRSNFLSQLKIYDTELIYFMDLLVYPLCFMAFD